MKRNYANEPDVYQLVLINPILNSKTLPQTRSRARWARIKLRRHEKASKLSVGDALDVLDRITKAEQSRVAHFIAQEAIYQQEIPVKSEALKLSDLP